MSSHYDTIPVESDHEDDDVTEHTPMIEDDARSERTRSADRSNFFRERSANSDSDPEEDPPSPRERAPLPRFFGRTPRIRVTMPRPPERAEPSSPAPPPISNPRATPSLDLWERTLRTLARWRESYRNTPAPQMESSSAIRQEFLLDTTPIIVDKLTRHEQKLDMIEEVVMDLPGVETLTEMQFQIDHTDNHVAYTNNKVQALEKQVKELTAQLKNMDHSIYQMENKMWDCQTMTAMAMGTTQDNLRTFFGDHAGGSRN